MNRVKVKINVADRSYPMVATPEEEEILRATGRKINELISDFEEKYNVRDKQDALAMCALQYVAKALAQEKKDLEQENLQSQAIDELVQKIHQNL